MMHFSESKVDGCAVFLLLQLCITTWKLFETMLCKRHRHVAHNLVLRNLTHLHAHVDSTPPAQHVNSASPCDASAAETKCINDDNKTAITHTDDVVSFSCASSPSNVSNHQVLVCESSDALASGDSSLRGIDADNISSPSSPQLSDNVVSGLQNSFSELNTRTSYNGEERTQVVETGAACVIDSVAGGDVNTYSHVEDKYRSTFDTQAIASLLSSQTSQVSTESSEISIQQVVYT